MQGGENIYPAEIENFLHKHPDIQDVAIVGAPHKELGEQVAAFVIPEQYNSKITHGDIKRFCDGQIAHFKIPSLVLNVDAFPLTVTGKVQKFVLRQQAEKLLANECDQQTTTH